MTIRISVLADQGILEVTYASGAVTAAALTEQRGMVADALSRHRLDKVLVDASEVTSFPSPFTVFEHNAAVAENGILQSRKFAVVCNSIGPNEQCLEDTGVNRGVIICCFTSREQAIAWLG